MSIEIERKFLVVNSNFKTEANTQYRIVQGFLNTSPLRTVRIRLKGEQGFLTVKGASTDDGLSRFEWEKSITKADALSLLDLCEPGIIDKIRYEVICGNHTFEVDEFFGANSGLIIAEVELSTKDESFIRPLWIGEEVTGDVRYYNSQLIATPYSLW